ncbi:hypothetical protein A0257_05980 [Hymenobacter psoromatis]|nr:hypothetical protein A0257_05980 [Hymenobacter psoromatis]
MLPSVRILDPKVQAEVSKHLLAALELLQPYQPDLTREEQKSLASKGMGRESIPFAQQAGLVLTSFKQVLSRTITDETIAAYPDQLATFDAASELQVPAQALVDLLAKVGLVAGAEVMDVARLVYKNVQDDNGCTPGLRDLEAKMAERFKANGVAKTPQPAKS